jgi:hypothetical protein
MAGYNDTRNLIIEALMGRQAGTEIQPAKHQAYALNMLDYVRSVELVSTSTLVGLAEESTVPVQPDQGKVCYIAGVGQDRTVTFSNFIDDEGNPISITTGEMEGVFVILLWNMEHWVAYTFNTNIISSAESANFYYGYNIRKTYASVAAMNADSVNPIGTDGRLIKIGELVTVVNSTTPAENGYYSYEGSENGWRLQSGFNFEIVQTTGTNINKTMSQKAVTDELALKASHGYASSPKTLKEVDDEIVQLAGETSVFYSDKTTFAEAALSVPKEKRKSGQQLTFGGYNNYQIWRNVTGDVLNDAVWSDSKYWIKLDSKVFNLEFEIDKPTTRKKLLVLCPKALSMGVIVSYLHPEDGLIVEINTDIAGGDIGWSETGWVTIYNASDKSELDQLAGEVNLKLNKTEALIINMDYMFPKSSGYYNSSDAIVSVPTSYRKQGLTVIYRSEDQIETYQYNGVGLSDSAWYDISLWNRLQINTGLKNLSINSDYRNPIGSASIGVTLSYEDNMLIGTSNGTSPNPRVLRLGVYELSKLGHKYYIGADVLVTSNNCNRISIFSIRDASAKNSLFIDNPSQNIWNKLRGISYIEFNNSSNVGFTLNTEYNSAAESVGSIFKIKNLVICDLTATYGEGNEPTLEEFEIELSKYPNGWFDGIVPLELTYSYTDNNYTDEDKELVDSIPNKVSKVDGMGLSDNNYTDEDKQIVNSLSGIDFDGLYQAKNAGEYHSENIHIDGAYAGDDKIIILNFHKNMPKFTPANNDIFFEGKAQNNFSDVRILDSQGNFIPFDILSQGNYDILTDNTLPVNARVDTLSDGTPISSFDTNSVSIFNGTTWEVISPDCGKLVFVALGDIIYTIKNNKIYRSEAPYDTFNIVLDFSIMDDGDGFVFQKSMGQFSSGELICGRYQSAWDVKIFRSIDNGITWNLCYETKDFQHVHGVYVDKFQNPEVGYAGFDGGGAVMRTLDKGLTWERLSGTIQSSDNVVAYAEQGFRLITGETSIVGGHSLIKTVDDVNFYPVLSNGKGYYQIQRLNNALYSGGISTNDSQGASIIRSIDDGETWKTVFSIGEMNEGGASDGFRHIGKATIGGVEQILAGCQTKGKYSSLRIFDGGDNYHAMVILKTQIPIEGLDIKVESGYFLKSIEANVSNDKLYADLLYLPLNNSENVIEEINNTPVVINSPNWIEGKGKKLWEFYPSIIEKNKKALHFSDTCYINQSFNIDLSEGNWTISFWSNINAATNGKKRILIAFNPLSENKQFLFLVNHQLHFNNTLIMAGFNYPQTIVDKLFTLTCDSNGLLKLYKNSGGLRAEIIASTAIDLSNFKGSLYLFGTPFTPSITGFSGVTNFDSPVNNVQIINRILSREEIASMYGGDMLDLY